MFRTAREWRNSLLLLNVLTGSKFYYYFARDNRYLREKNTFFRDNLNECFAANGYQIIDNDNRIRTSKKKGGSCNLLEPVKNWC